MARRAQYGVRQRDKLGVRDRRHNSVVLGVRSDEVAFSEHALHDRKRFAALVDEAACYEEDSLGVFRFKRVENLLGVAVFVAAVERQVADLLVSVFAVDAAVKLKEVERARITVPGIRHVAVGVAFDCAGIPVEASRAAILKGLS